MDTIPAGMHQYTLNSVLARLNNAMGHFGDGCHYKLGVGALKASYNVAGDLVARCIVAGVFAMSSPLGHACGTCAHSLSSVGMDVPIGFRSASSSNHHQMLQNSTIQ